MSLRLAQFVDEHGERAIAACPDGGPARRVLHVRTTHELALRAARHGSTLAAKVEALGVGAEIDLAAVLREARMLPPIDHPDPAHLLLTGTGLTHLGSAEGRDRMHRVAASTGITDSMRMFQSGVDGGEEPEIAGIYFEIEAAPFGLPLRNMLGGEADLTVEVRVA